MKNLKLNFALLFFIVLIHFIQVGLTQTSYNLPNGWFKAGSHRENYLMGVDSTIFYGEAPGSSGSVKSISNFNGFGTLMQNFFPKEYLDKRVRLSAFVKSNNVTGWAGMWMRADTVSNQYLDNMLNVLDISEFATNLAFGILLSGEGEVWLDECKFEIVDPKIVNLTDVVVFDEGVEANPNALQYPINLSF
ncbi:15719_t:CDS:2 [Funneliformis geosporum]|uniref:1088_t:CDS:1 n=1 Tax=Funneliformis geosporum TaxID=1117311 RepID=A0A9W4SNL2_9GLOM|nr:15719_t:CDS:2 [Funneliformis geosporum]CAI2175869.1 1088_t:CDS:2 [Funneliformis geosporum]